MGKVMHGILALLAVALLAPCSGCLRPAASTAYERDGVYYGKTAGRFRGRWWNYYERAQSFMDGGFYAQAEADLRVALMGRDRDQLWPRTYGLHFIPAYFPHRELGIVHYYQSAWEASLEELELSYEQRPSARAAYFLGEVRRHLLQASASEVAPPLIEVQHPKPGAVESATEMLVSGIARGAGYVDQIVVNGQRCDVAIAANEVAFSQSVRLGPGENEIAVEAIDLLGKRASIRIPIACDVDGPSLSFDTPVLMPGVIQGVIHDPSGIASMTIGGREAALTPLDETSAHFSLTLAEADLDPPILYAASDSRGNCTEGRVTPDLLVLESRIPELTPASIEEVRLPGALRALKVNGRIVAVAAAQENAKGVAVELSNIEDGQEYFSDEIQVSMRVEADAPIDQLALNDTPLTPIPGRKQLCISRRIRLEEGENQVRASAVDSGGGKAEAKKTVQRRPNEMEMKRNKLRVAFLGEASKAQSPQSAAEMDALLGDLIATREVANRFTVVDRARMEEILREQNLSELLASREGKLQLGQLITAEILFTARVRRDQAADTIEIVIDGASAETGVRVLSHVDVAGPYAEVERLIEDLGLRLSQEFRRIQGIVLDWNPPEVYFNLTQAQGMRDYLKCLVYRTTEIKHPQTGATLGVKPEVLAEGTIIEVQDQMSAAEVVPMQEESSVDDLAIEVGCYVVLK